MASPSEVLAAALRLPPTLGEGRLICIDGLAGSGKTTLAAAVADLAPGTVVIATDEMLEGWQGLPGLGRSIETLLRPLAAGQPGHWWRWDWHADDWAEAHALAPTPLLILEGVGSAAASYDELVTLLVWVEADRETRLARGLARDGDDQHDHWLTWLDDEAALHERENTRARADVVIRT